MKEYINNLVLGNYRYKKSKISFDSCHIKEDVMAGQKKNLMFTFSASDDVKGIVYTDIAQIKIKNNMFYGKECTIEYSVDASQFFEGKTINGCFMIVSDAGEFDVTFEFNVVSEYIETSQGNAYNMFHFANLVQTAPKEAASVFRSMDFKKIFIKNDFILSNIYDLVHARENINEAIEEFLIAAKKKAHVTINILQNEIEIENISENIKNIIQINRNCWGYLRVRFSTDSEWIELIQNEIQNEDFTGNKYEFEYIINEEKLHDGINFGRIIIQTFSQTLIYEIKVSKNPANNKLMLEKKRASAALIKEYLNFRMKKEDRKGWIANSLKILEDIRKSDTDDDFFRLAQAQVYTVEGRFDEASWLINSIKDKFEGFMEGSLETKSEKEVELYSYFLYVRALAANDFDNDNYINEALSNINVFYENGFNTWRIQWILFYLNQTEEQNKSIRLLRIKDLFKNGCTSPVMYYEALHIINSQPSLLRVINDFEYQLILFGCKYEIITGKLATQICNIIAAEKIADIKYLQLLIKLNKLFDNDEILLLLVTHMVRNELTGKQYFSIYEKGVLRGLKITRLYEYYMESQNMDIHKKLPQIVIRYFSYGNTLSVAAKAYLYADIIINNGTSKEIMTVYGPQIEKFIYEQMKAGNINDNMIILYKYFFDQNPVNEETSGFLSRYLFTYKITVFDENIEHVIVKHKELRNSSKFNVTGNTAYIQMYTSDCAIVFEDEEGIYQKGSVKYEIEKIYDRKDFIESVCCMCGRDFYMQLYLYEYAMKNGLKDEVAFAVCQYLMNSGYVNNETRMKINSWFIQLFNLQEDDVDFKNYYSQIITEGLSKDDSKKLMEKCIASKMYNEAFKYISEYGFENIDMSLLVVMIRNIIEQFGLGLNENVLNCCKYVYANGKYDESVLRYLEKNYNSSSYKMLKVWRACGSFHITCVDLSERLSAQMLFTDIISEKYYEVFTYYYLYGTKKDLKTAYISEASYKYLLENNITDKKIFEYIYDYIDCGNKLNDICLLAFLKYYVNNKNEIITNYHKKMLQNILDNMCSRNILLSFFGEYKDILRIPYNIADVTVIEYFAEPGKKVKIHYKSEKDNEFLSEIMKSNVDGIYTKVFRMFYNDNIQYYITQEDENGIVTGEKNSIIGENGSSGISQSRFDCINDMLMSMEMHDMITMKRLMQKYITDNYVTDELFKPMK